MMPGNSYRCFSRFLEGQCTTLNNNFSPILSSDCRNECALSSWCRVTRWMVSTCAKPAMNKLPLCWRVLVTRWKLSPSISRKVTCWLHPATLFVGILVFIVLCYEDWYWTADSFQPSHVDVANICWHSCGRIFLYVGSFVQSCGYIANTLIYTVSSLTSCLMGDGLAGNYNNNNNFNFNCPISIAPCGHNFIAAYYHVPWPTEDSCFSLSQCYQYLWKQEGK